MKPSISRPPYEPVLSENALRVLQRRYFRYHPPGDSSASPTRETPVEFYTRVARAIAAPEKGTKTKKDQWAREFYELMASSRFLPNSPTLMNAGMPQGQLAACFVLPVDDTLDGIFGTLRDAAKIHQSGGGTGFAFSRLRAAGSRVKSTNGVASGPLSFAKIYDTATETIKQGGARRGANMAILRVDHPDIESFIESKRDFNALQNFNISVGITHEFMRAVENDAEFKLREPKANHLGVTVRTVRARELFKKMTEAAWTTGDPGLVFLDRMNFLNPTPLAGEFESTNPCGEQPLLPYESCNLGSLNVGEYVKRGNSSALFEMDWSVFERDVEIATRFLDNVIDANHYPISASRKITLRNRKIGLGVMGFADALVLLGMPYDSDPARAFGEKLMARLDHVAKATSIKLARERGAFPNFKGSMWERLGYPKMRNATVTTVAPTGTISVIAGCSSGVEPIFSAFFFRNVLDGQRLADFHPVIGKLLGPEGLKALGPEPTDATLKARLGDVWSPAQAVSIEGHIRMQAAFQRFSDSAVSKTINLRESATVDEVARAYRLAFDLGCKGITIYRDRSRPTQVLEKG